VTQSSAGKIYEFSGTAATAAAITSRGVVQAR
jgi:hypothetical protein